MKFSRMMLGTVQFGLDYGVANTGGKVPYMLAREIIAFAAAHNVNTLDTAAAYGNSEAVLGRALKELKLRKHMQVISKVPSLAACDNPRKFILETVTTSLSRLGAECLAAVLFHDERDFVHIEILRELEDAGLIAGCGVSLNTDEYCNEVLAAGIKYIQLPYNILDRRFDAFLELAKKQNVNIFARSIYLQGLPFMDEKFIPDDLRDVLPVRRRLEKIAERENMKVIELCLRFVLANDAVCSFLTGVDSVAQLSENVRLFAQDGLSSELCEEIKQTVGHLPKKIIMPINWNKYTKKK